ncbi:hypothetical protein QQS21_010330 [Conoideocrella luteorostrata]|uniref:Uncharacterized protein n=1 Tax=Conoideocrella luteorostrata TaxID=1105319 RepID=A0AAJ0FUS4_9HYPO|nr:hypothetical protein QQS21_010330 [Conoideocrella luteorostrata]
METSTSLTVGRISGIIALGNTIVSFTIPLLLCLALVRCFDKSKSAASWSVLARQLHSTAWPSLLRVDTVSRKNVQWDITIVSYLNTCMAVLKIISGVVTPLGLGEIIAPVPNQEIDFEYVRDLTTFGHMTMNRPPMPLS